MRYTATLQSSENVQAYTHSFAISGQRLLYAAQHLRTPAAFTPQVANSSPPANKILYLTVQKALAIHLARKLIHRTFVRIAGHTSAMISIKD